MHRSLRFVATGLAMAMVVLGCAPTRSPSPGAVAGGPATLTVKRITASVMAEPPIIVPKLSKVLPGSEAMEVLVQSGMAIVAPSGLHPQLAQEVPSVENGLWRVHPDGRMETTWKVRANAFWHDGSPFTADDLVFTATVGRDADLPNFRHPGYRAIETVEVIDPTTALVRWTQPYVGADTLFSSSLNSAIYTPPLPKHLLESAYLSDKPGFTDLPYWAEEFVGTGPYRVRDWVRGSHVVLAANDRYFLGRPKIDVIEVKFIPDANTLVTNILAGAIDVTLGRGLSIEQATDIRDQWREGRMEVGILNWVTIFPQFVNSSPAIVGDVRFRRALMHALDRQELVDTIQKGLVPVAHSYIGPNDPDYKDIAGSIVRYEFDQRRAVQLIEGLGYSRGADRLFRDATGQQLTVEIRTTAENTIHRSTLLSVVDYWRQAGVAAEPLFVPPQQQADREYRSTYPAFELLQHPNSVEGLSRFHSRETPLPENNFRLSGNNGRYMNPEFDAFIDRYFRTIPKQERGGILAQIIQHITDRVTMMGLFYQMEPSMIGNRIANAGAKTVGSTPVWNVHEWELR